jgi:SAM-dependent methyltransferase
MIGNLIEFLALAYLRSRKSAYLRKEGVVDADEPLRLMRAYEHAYGNDLDSLWKLVADVLDLSAEDVERALVGTTLYEDFRRRVEQPLDLFEQRPYQLGALDAEIDLVVALLCQFDGPDVLEVGVANGYSTAFLYYALAERGGTILSVDLPRFAVGNGRLSRFNQFPNLHLREWLAGRGLLETTGTLKDLKPGGVIPEDRYAGWLVPMELRRQVDGTMIYGDMFNVLTDMSDAAAFDVAVFDAMKGYDARMRALGMLVDRLRPGGLCIVDGYWVNTAFADFCERHGYACWEAGRLGVLVKRPA